MDLNNMSYMPEADKNHESFLDFLAEACKKTVKIPDNTTKEGYRLQQEVDWKKPYYKLQNINYKGYSRTVFEVERLEGLLYDLFNRMTPERAKIIFEQGMSYLDSIRYSMDAKSSEMIRDKDNTQNNLTNMLTKVRVDRSYSSNEELKKGMFDGLFGDKNRDQQAH